jgi:hypothetical protein
MRQSADDARCGVGRHPSCQQAGPFAGQMISHLITIADKLWAGFQENGRLKLAARPRAITSRLQALISFCCAAVPTVAEK